MGAFTALGDFGDGALAGGVAIAALIGATRTGGALRLVLFGVAAVAAVRSMNSFRFVSAGDF